MSTVEERQALAEEDLAKKLKLEKPLAIKTRELLRNLSRDVALTYGATGAVFDAGTYKDDFEGILLPSYRRAEKEFGTVLSRQVLPTKPGTERLFLRSIFEVLAYNRSIAIEDKISEYQHKRDKRLRAFTDSEVPKRAGFITETNQKEIDRAIARAVSEASESLVPVSRVAIGARAGQIFRDSSLYRGQLIATTEIQNAAEGSKDIEANTMDEEIRPLADDSRVSELDRVKEWHTQGDEKVRPSHILADLERKKFDESFLVQGERLMYPGDKSLGASLWNTINCRCSAIYFIDGRIERIRTANQDIGIIPEGSLDIVN